MITHKEIITAFVKKSAEGYKAELSALIKKYNASCLAEIKPESYVALLLDIEVLGSE